MWQQFDARFDGIEILTNLFHSNTGCLSAG
jgi:hypothetical protein